MARRKKPTLADRWLEMARQRGMTARPTAATRSGKQLWKLLDDSHAPVRLAAGFAIAAARDPALVQACIFALKGASSKRLAAAAVRLGEAGFVNAAPYLAASFTHGDRQLSAALARAMGLLADRASLPLLVDALERDFVPAEAAEALGHLGEVKAAPALLRALGHKREKVRAAAAYSLGCLRAMPEADERHVREGLAKLSRDASRKVRLCAAVARYEREDQAGLSAIRAALS